MSFRSHPILQYGHKIKWTEVFPTHSNFQLTVVDVNGVLS